MNGKRLVGDCMKRSLAFILLILVLEIAKADWLLLQSEPEGIKHYVDSEVKKTEDGLRRIWVLMDVNLESIGSGFSYSIRSLHEFDCRQQSYRVLTATTYSGLKASGAVVKQGATSPDWRYVPPETIAARYFKFACFNKI